MLFSGTLRENLDPFGKHEDAELNAALRAAGLSDLHLDTSITETISSPSTSEDPFVVPEGAAETGHHKIGLDTTVESGGSNFSLGQRQIVALARAIVRRSKLLILDEATAAIGVSCPSVFQCSRLTICAIIHRLRNGRSHPKGFAHGIRQRHDTNHGCAPSSDNHGL